MKVVQLLAAATGIGLIAMSAHTYAQESVIDQAAILQMTQQLLNDATEIAILKDQLKQAGATTSAITGSYGRGGIGRDVAKQSAHQMLDTWQDVVAQQQSCKDGFSLTECQQETRLNTMPSIGDGTQANTTYQAGSTAVRSSMAANNDLYNELQVHLQNIDELTAEIDETTNAKDAADLQSRVAAENAYISIANGKIQAMNLNVQANVLNGQNQGQAQAAKFFGVHINTTVGQ